MFELVHSIMVGAFIYFFYTFTTKGVFEENTTNVLGSGKSHTYRPPMKEQPWDVEEIFNISQGFPVYWGYRCGHWELGTSNTPGSPYRLVDQPFCPCCKERNGIHQ